jgi:hypothetical protein
MKNSDSWPQTLQVRLDAKEMLRFARQEAFHDDDFPLTMTRRVISLNITADYFLPELDHLERNDDGWLIKSPDDLPKYLRVFGLSVQLPEVLLEGERHWELRLSKHGGWDVFSINDHVLAVLGGDDLPPGPLPPGNMPLGVSFCARHSLSGLPLTERITELLIQSENPILEKLAPVNRDMKTLEKQQLSYTESCVLPDGLPGRLRHLDLRLFRGKLTPGSLESLTCLEELQLSKTTSASLCTAGSSSMALPVSLRQLTLQITRGTADFGFLRGLHQLQALDLRGGMVTVSLEPLAELHDLEDISLSFLNQTKDLEPLRGLKKLRRLSLGGMTELVDLSPIACLPTLHDLMLIQCDSLVDVSPLVQLPSLRNLMLMDCDSIQDVSVLESITGLQIQR